MPAPIYLGDEVTAAGYRLAGAQVFVPEPGTETEALERARAQAELVLVAAAIASRVRPAVLAQALSSPSPLTVVVPDLSGAELPDVATRLRAQLGLESA